MFAIAICDDDKEFLSTLREYVESYGLEKEIDVCCSSFSSGEEFLDAYVEQSYELIFLDVEMGGIDGVTLSKRIWETERKTTVVFITGHIGFIQEAMESHPFQYLIKPVGREKVYQVLDHYFSLVDRGNHFFERGKVKVCLDDILCIEKRGNQLYLFTNKGMFEVYGSLKDAMTMLDDSFVQCHKGFVANLSKVFRYKHNSCIIKGYEHPIPIGRKYKDSFIKAYMEYMNHHWRCGKDAVNGNDG